jgi:hypothetical protein
MSNDICLIINIISVSTSSFVDKFVFLFLFLFCPSGTRREGGQGEGPRGRDRKLRNINSVDLDGRQKFLVCFRVLNSHANKFIVNPGTVSKASTVLHSSRSSANDLMGFASLSLDFYSPIISIAVCLLITQLFRFGEERKGKTRAKANKAGGEGSRGKLSFHCYVPNLIKYQMFISSNFPCFLIFFVNSIQFPSWHIISCNIYS